MNELEFFKEARRIAIAFNAPKDAQEPFQFEDEGEDDYYLLFDVGDLKIQAAFSGSTESWDVGIANKFKRRGILSCSIGPDHPLDIEMNNCSECSHHLARALLCLGLDISTMEKTFNLTISAHEKLEWQLEFARRMREDARENGV